MKYNLILKKLRKEQNLTQKDIYIKLNVSPNCYASWEQGRTEPSIDMIKKLCNIFNITADYLLGLEDEFGDKIEEKQYKYEFEYKSKNTYLKHKEE